MSGLENNVNAEKTSDSNMDVEANTHSCAVEFLSSLLESLSKDLDKMSGITEDTKKKFLKEFIDENGPRDALAALLNTQYGCLLFIDLCCNKWYNKQLAEDNDSCQTKYAAFKSLAW